MEKRRKPETHRVEDEDNSFIQNTASKAIELRSKETEFYGLQRELLYLRSEMIAAYTKSKDMKHPRDKGRAREIILENFLTETGLVPRKYGVSSTSARVVSTTGHSSKELDIVIYDYLENVHLMKRNSALEYYPRETVLGVIQVKSKLGRLEIANAFENIASYKALYDGITPYARIFTGRIPTTKDFGIIFAYGSDLEWTSSTLNH